MVENMRNVYFVWHFVIASTMCACDASSPNEQMSFRNAEYAQQVIVKLEKENVSYKKINETTIVFSVDDSSKVLRAAAEIDAGAPLMYEVRALDMKSKFENALKENDIPYKVSDNSSGGYSFLIEKKYQRTVHELFVQITKGR